jgi:hypothetical protein
MAIPSAARGSPPPKLPGTPDGKPRNDAAIAATGPRGERMVAFSGCMYYAALRPEEAVDLRLDNLTDLPDNGWGEMLLTHSEPRSMLRVTGGSSTRRMSGWPACGPICTGPSTSTARSLTCCYPSGAAG